MYCGIVIAISVNTLNINNSQSQLHRVSYIFAHFKLSYNVYCIHNLQSRSIVTDGAQRTETRIYAGGLVT